ncbi:cytochrome P450 [Micromonospora sp. NPDC048894]|uniref:cytochrome P450 n=1 Tax=unclassified Micromonospora TaxID=2617518 RepID=UPI0033E8FADD
MTEDGVPGAPAFPMPRTCPFSPPREYAELRAARPLSRVTLQDGNTAWLATSHEYVRTLLGHPATSANRAHPGFPATVANVQAFAQKGFLLSMDQPEHSLHRRMVAAEFTVHRIRQLRPRIQQIVDDRIDVLLAIGTRPVDLVRELALPVPSLVICELLGVPYGSREVFQGHTEVLLARASTPQQRQESFGALRAFLGDLVSSKDGNPDDDLLGRLSVKYRAADCYDHELLTGFAMLLLLAGHETTASMISLGLLALLRDERLATQLTDDPTLTPNAVEELLRYFSIVDYPTARVALADIDLGADRVRAGEGFVASAAAANHDGDVFADPGTIDFRRGVRGHVAFGYGVHQCLGQNLARAELEIVYDTVLARLPAMKLLTSPEEQPFKEATVYGLHSLEVTW